MNIKEAVESFINFRRSIGRKDESKTYTLRLFANFMGETTEISSITLIPQHYYKLNFLST